MNPRKNLQGLIQYQKLWYHLLIKHKKQLTRIVQNEYSCNISSGLYRVSSELNDSVADGYIVAQGQIDFMTGDFNCKITDTGAGASFGVNMASASGTIGLQKKINNRNIKATVSGSVGINFGGCIEISWRKRK